MNHDRRMSAPARVATNSRPVLQQPILQHGSSYNVSDPSSVNSTRNTSPVSLISSSASSASTTSVIEPQQRNSERSVTRKIRFQNHLYNFLNICGKRVNAIVSCSTIAIYLIYLILLFLSEFIPSHLGVHGICYELLRDDGQIYT